MIHAPALSLVTPPAAEARLHPAGPSLAERLAATPDWANKISAETLAAIGGKKPGEGLWRFWARMNQIAPLWQWQGWLLMMGRASGKTRTASEWCKERIDAGEKYLALVGATAHDVRTVMVEGESGILRVFGPRARFESSKRQIRFDTGAIAELHYSTEPESLRGPTYGSAWFDEPAKCALVGDLNATWDNLMMCLRGGADPRWIATTTPLPLTLLRELLKDPAVAVSLGSTYDNKANLPAGYYAGILKKYEGTRLGRQELMGEILEVEGALFKPAWILRGACNAVPLRTVVAVDPAISHRHDETGIVVVRRGRDDRGYVLDDRSQRSSPEQWARDAVEAYVKHRADLMIGERDRGGDFVETVIRGVARSMGVNVVYADVKAYRGKGQRAEPVAALYEQKRITHVGVFRELEDQMCNWDPKTAGSKKAKSPDRMDAMVHGFNELFGGIEIDSGGIGRAGSRRW